VIRVSVMTISDRCSRGERKDLSGPRLVELVSALNVELLGTLIVADEVEQIQAGLLDFARNQRADLILTTGGTGLSARDVTPEATAAVLDREIPGISEAMRIQNLKHTPYAMLSRGLAGLIGSCLVVNLPGSVKAVEENFAVISPVIRHALQMTHGDTHESYSP